MNIGYYAHHHGSGHCRQADKLANLLQSGSVNSHSQTQNHSPQKNNISDKLITVFTSMSSDGYAFKHIAETNIVRLPDEHEREDDVLKGRAGEYWQPRCLHYSPVGNVSIQKRSHKLLDGIQSGQIAIMIIDLSVEVALLCRTASIPYLYMRLPGERNDVPHINAFQGAIGLLATYPKVLESPSTPEWVRQKTIYLGFLNRALPSVSADGLENRENLIAKINTLLLKNQTENRAKSNEEDALDKRPQTVLDLQNRPIVTVIKGFGGHKNIDNTLPKLRRLLPNAFIISLGPIDPEAIQYVDIATKVDDVSPFLQYSTLLVMSCGLNAIGEACEFDTPLLVVPDVRPHDEHKEMAASLIQSGRAIKLHRLEIELNNNGNLKLPLAEVLKPFKPNKRLIGKLQHSRGLAFINSISEADNVKAWFTNWLLPQLDCQPERL